MHDMNNVEKDWTLKRGGAFFHIKLVQIMDVSLKIEHAHTESAELRPQNLARLHIYLVARWSPIFSLIG